MWGYMDRGINLVTVECIGDKREWCCSKNSDIMDGLVPVFQCKVLKAALIREGWGMRRFRLCKREIMVYSP